MEYKTKPFKHQAEIFNKIKDARCYGLFWEMGVGKTKPMIDLIRYRYEKYGVKPVLIICPKVVRKSWLKQFGIHSDMSDLVSVMKKDMLLSQLKSTPVLITNYDSLKRFGPELQSITWGIKIADESHRIKNHKSIRGKESSKIPSESSFILSGSPILKNLMDVYNQIKFLDENIFGPSFEKFKYRYFIDKNARWKRKPGYWPKWELNENRKDELMKKLSSVSDRKEKKDCLDLPDEVFEIINIDMSDEQEKAYNDVRDELIHWISEQEAVTAQNVLVKSIRLVQISSGFMKTDTGKIRIFKQNPKADELEKILHDITDNHKVVITCAFRQDIEYLRYRFSNYNPGVLHGGEDTMDKFVNEEDSRILLAHPKNLIGINDLVIADYMIRFSNTYSLDDRLQSKDRIHRPGQTKKCTFIDFVASDIDEIILENLTGKNTLANGIYKYLKCN